LWLDDSQGDPVMWGLYAALQYKNMAAQHDDFVPETGKVR
jgi:hypothetical protein